MFLKTIKTSTTSGYFNVLCDTLSNNSFLIGGTASRSAFYPGDSLTGDSYLIKNQISGLTKWIKRYHLKNKFLIFSDIKVLRNKDILIGGGLLYQDGITPNDGILLLLDSNGYIKWARKYVAQEIYRILPLQNQEIAIATTDSGKNIKLVKLDSQFNQVWSRKYVDPSFNINPGFTGTFDLVEGNNKSLLTLSYNYLGSTCIILTDSSGNKIRDFRTYSTDINLFYSGINAYNSGFYICGARVRTQLYGIVFRLDNNLNVNWFKGYFPDNWYCGEFLGIGAYNKNKLLLMSEPENAGGWKMSHQVLLDSNGLIKKGFKFMSDSFITYPNSLKILSSGKFIFTSLIGQTGFGLTDTVSNNFCGYQSSSYTLIDSIPDFIYETFTSFSSTFNYTSENIQAYAPSDLIIDYSCSFGPNGPLDPFDPPNTVGHRELEAEVDLEIFPNPINELLFIRNKPGLEGMNYYDSEVTLINSLGEMAYQEKRFLTDRAETFNLKNIPNGVYVLSVVSSKNKRFYKKVIIAN